MGAQRISQSQLRQFIPHMPGFEHRPLGQTGMSACCVAVGMRRKHRQFLLQVLLPAGRAFHAVGLGGAPHQLLKYDSRSLRTDIRRSALLYY